MATLTSISITPVDPYILVSSTQQFVLTAHFSDAADDPTVGTDPTTVWSSSNTAVATISTTSPTKGLATSLTISGSSTIIATYGGFTATTILRVGLTNYVKIIEPPVEGIRVGETSFNAAHNPISRLSVPTISSFAGSVAFTNSIANSGGPIGYTVVSGHPGNFTALYVANEQQQVGQWVQLNASIKATTAFTGSQRNLGVVASVPFNSSNAQLTSSGSPVLVQVSGEAYVFATNPINAGDFLGPDDSNAGHVKSITFDPANPTPILGFALENFGASFGNMVYMRIQICGD